MDNNVILYEWQNNDLWRISVYLCVLSKAGAFLMALATIWYKRRLRAWGVMSDGAAISGTGGKEEITTYAADLWLMVVCGGGCEFGG